LSHAVGQLMSARFGKAAEWWLATGRAGSKVNNTANNRLHIFAMSYIAGTSITHSYNKVGCKIGY